MFQGSGHLTPWIDSTGALGTSSKRWSNVHADGATIAGNATISGDLDVDGHTNLDNADIVGVTTHYEKVLIRQIGGTTSTNVVPLEVQAYRGDSTTGITTVLFEANGLKRPEFILNNTHNGNWNNSNGQTQHWRMLWRAPNETNTTDDVVELKPNTSITGSLNSFSKSCKFFITRKISSKYEITRT